MPPAIKIFILFEIIGRLRFEKVLVSLEFNLRVRVSTVIANQLENAYCQTVVAA